MSGYMLFALVPAAIVGVLGIVDTVHTYLHNRKVDRLISSLGSLPRVSPMKSETRSYGVR